jgi:hypothetical protein
VGIAAGEVRVAESEGPWAYRSHVGRVTPANPHPPDRTRNRTCRPAVRQRRFGRGDQPAARS